MEDRIAAILDRFRAISAIPRCSKHEAQLAAWLTAWAREQGFAVQSDRAGNLVVRVPASPGRENRPTVVLQGHMDMVCEKTPESEHDFERDPIRVIREGDWLHADGTTLGADNGIALAMMMVLAQDAAAAHPPLELVFTVDEESGLIGAHDLEAAMIEGRILVNIDSEDEGVFTIGCAGGEETLMRLPLSCTDLPADAVYARLVVGGLRGGHSGVDIHKPRANANRLLGRALARLQAQEGVRLVSLSGGSAHNAIPRDAAAFLAAAPEAAPRVPESVADLERVFKEEHAGCEPRLTLRWEIIEAPLPDRALTPESAARAVRLINALPHGVHGMSTHVAGLVETSCNLAILRIEQEALEIVSSQRSSSMSRMAEMTERVTSVAALAGASATRMNHHPAWAPDPDSALLRRCREVYRSLYDKEPVVEVIHAGLECGLIGDKLPGMEMISIGPNLKNPHSPEERLELSSVGRVYAFLTTLLASY